MHHIAWIFEKKEVAPFVLSLAIMIFSLGAVGNPEVPFVAINFTGPTDDAGIVVWSAMDGGYLFTGLTRSFGAGDVDAWLVKADENGTELWNKTFGGTGQDAGVYFRPTRDGGYIITGWTNSSGAGDTDVLMIKTDANGTEMWSRTFGGEADDRGRTVHQTRDGGYIVGGTTDSFGGEGRNFLLIKTDASGNEMWNRTYGGAGKEIFNTAQPTMGGYVVIGGTNSTAAGDWDILLIRADENGTELWNKTLGGPGNQTAIAFDQNNKGGYTITGITNVAGNNDALLIETDANGNELWSKSFGGMGDDQGRDVLETREGGYLIVGWTNSSGSGGIDVLLVRTDSMGEELWTMTYGSEGDDRGRFIAPTYDGGYIVVGESRSVGGDWNALLVKIDANGNEVWMNTYGG
jgi:regulation of enolase protein 1 (concanavalin A-like superfamily)